ncbi:hypothetical protein ACFFT4_11585 [Cohnella cellulosilytica]|uniref:hypothetical protein n=1 Tax=Cohnella cellulosilytica TaxID=986710 RepID=UPI0035EB61AC
MYLNGLLYTYVRNNPLKYVDPSGLNPAAACLIPPIGAACAAAATAVAEGELFILGVIGIELWRDSQSEEFDTIQDGQKVIQQSAVNQGYTVLQQSWFQSGSGVYQQNKIRIMPKEQLDLAPASV